MPLYSLEVRPHRVLCFNVQEHRQGRARRTESRGGRDGAGDEGEVGATCAFLACAPPARPRGRPGQQQRTRKKRWSYAATKDEEECKAETARGENKGEAKEGSAKRVLGNARRELFSTHHVSRNPLRTLPISRPT
jgi:hypothetical protein